MLVVVWCRLVNAAREWLICACLAAQLIAGFIFRGTPGGQAT
jgi:hypothetical protein